MTYPIGPGYPTKAEIESYERLKRERMAKAEQRNQPNSKTSKSVQASWARAFAAVRSEASGD